MEQLSAFDWVVSVALGSTLASVVLDTTVSWTEGIAALVMLATLQFALAWTTAR